MCSGKVCGTWESEWKRQRGRAKMPNSGKIAKWMGGSMEEMMLDLRDHAMSRRLVRGTARAADCLT